MSLTKHDIVEQVHYELGFPKNQSVEIVESLLEIIKASLESGDDRTGSHNLVTGGRQNYSHYGGLVAGFYNTISSAYASVSGGLTRSVSGSNDWRAGGYFQDQ